MPSPDAQRPAAPDTATRPGARPRHDTRAAAWTWLALIVLTLLGVLASAQGAAPARRLAMGLLVAALCAFKADLLIRHYLHARDAGPVFHALVRLFAALAPLALALSVLREAG